MYPLKMVRPDPLGFAVANTREEHATLTEWGYEPPLAKEPGQTIESVRAQLDAAGISYDKRLGLSRLLELLPKG